jgi:hypothetical protein
MCWFQGFATLHFTGPALFAEGQDTAAAAIAPAAQVEGVAPRGTVLWSHTLSPALTYPGTAERLG